MPADLLSHVDVGEQVGCRYGRWRVTGALTAGQRVVAAATWHPFITISSADVTRLV